MCPQRGVAFLGRVLLGVCVGWRMACGAMRIIIRIRCDWLRSQLGFSITPAAMVLSTRMTGWDTSVRDISSLLSFQYIRTNLLSTISLFLHLQFLPALFHQWISPAGNAGVPLPSHRIHLRPDLPTLTILQATHSNHTVHKDQQELYRMHRRLHHFLQTLVSQSTMRREGSYISVWIYQSRRLLGDTQLNHTAYGEQYESYQMRRHKQ